jgi:hypothetical protein
MKIENLSVKSFQKQTTETDEGVEEKYAAILEKDGFKVKFVFDEKPEQAFVPAERFTVSLSNPQKKLVEEKNAKPTQDDD